MAIDREQLLHVRTLGSIAFKYLGTRFRREARKLTGRARGKRDLHSVLAEKPRQRGAQPASGAYDESDSISRHAVLSQFSSFGAWNRSG